MPREQRPEHSVAASSTLMAQLLAEPGGGSNKMDLHIGDPSCGHGVKLGGRVL